MIYLKAFAPLIFVGALQITLIALLHPSWSALAIYIPLDVFLAWIGTRSLQSWREIEQLRRELAERRREFERQFERRS